MNEATERNHIHNALVRTLSPVAGDPTLEERVLQQVHAAPHPFRPMKLMLIPALLLLLVTGAFAAGRLGLIDMLQQGRQNGVMPEAGQLVNEPVVLHAAQSDHAALTVVQSLRSGSDVLLLIEATPHSDGMLIAPASLLGTLADNGACRARMGFGWEDEDAILTHAENAGKQLIALEMRLQLPGEQKAIAIERLMLDGELLENGGVRLLLHAENDAFAGDGEVTLHLGFTTTPVHRSEPAPESALQPSYAFDGPQRSAAFQAIALPAVPSTAAQAIVPPALTADEAALPIHVEEAGLLIQGVTLVRTPLHTRFEVRYTCLYPREEMADREAFFLLSDAQGRWLADGVRGGSTVHGAWPSYTRIGYASALPGTVDEVWLTVMPFGSNVPLAHVRVPVTIAEPETGIAAPPTPAP